ncbi:hypothetical protein PFICI_13344 [Pestalotiopsis fici W106-1]|uniref:Uncharacterized protein n=1 Tax=Pestalotiopsis fici (strain W106-1 / CGMCC3.15140) TaxID=1229662 RepID=W3WLR8_PESFW|nr:uncharacterized protein PFICI_13344 [Pestalotiopsis fici W106-1]ETS74860.1 hypothetical protein PFICI_13344 [Pestalotiopsis fici W106-1]
MLFNVDWFLWLTLPSQAQQSQGVGKREGPYWLHITSDKNISVDGYAYRDPNSRTGFFTYDPAKSGHDARISEDSHFMLYRPSNSTDNRADLISYSNPGLKTPDPDDPVPGAAHLRLAYTPSTPLAQAYFAHPEDNYTWPIQYVSVQESSGRLGINGSSNIFGVDAEVGEFLSQWFICWGMFTTFFWSVAPYETSNYCTAVQITLEKIVK